MIEQILVADLAYSHKFAQEIKPHLKCVYVR
jgi:hypothetical protein